MSGRFDFVSPGAAFTDSLTQTLAQRKAEERQHLLDSLTMSAEQRADREAEQMQRYRDSQIAESQQRGELAQLGELTNGMSMDAEVTDPKHIALLQKYNKLKKLPTANVSTDITGMQADGQDLGKTESTTPTPAPTAAPVPTKDRWGYVGTTAEQKDLRDRVEVQGVIAKLMSDPDPQKQLLGKTLSDMVTANHGAMTPDALSRLGPGSPISVFHQETGKTENTGQTIPAGGTLVTQSRPQRELQPRNYQLLGTMPDGSPYFRDSFGNPVTDLPAGLRPPRNPGDLPDKGLGISQGKDDAYQVALAGLAQDATKPENIMLVRRNGHAMISSATTSSQQVKTLAGLMLDDPMAFNSAMQNTQLTDKEIAEIEEFKGLLNIDEIAKTLASQPVKHAPAHVAPQPTPKSIGWNSHPGQFDPQNFGPTASLQQSPKPVDPRNTGLQGLERELIGRMLGKQ